jgi:hypothetical protein
MTTDRQIEADQRNAQLITGPKTDDGEVHSRDNAINHGMAGDPWERIEWASHERIESAHK